jgi:alkylation response protein AidB-like acyl-CoA dehydrogenase
MPAGYSKRTLPEKLGIKPGTRIVALGAPPAYSALLGTLPSGATLHTRLPSECGFIHRFVRRRDELAANFPRLARALNDAGVLWISWPKKASGVDTDLTENIVRGIGLAEGLVDVKVCAVDEVWSGLKFVRRIENRSKRRDRQRSS